MERVEQPHRLMAAAIEAAEIGIWRREAGSNVMHWGGIWDRIFIPSEGGFDGTFEGLLRIVADEDREGLRRTIQAASDEIGPYTHEFRVLWPDGQIRWVRIWGRYSHGGTGTMESVGAFRDTTAVRDLQGQLVRAQRLQVIGHLAAGVAHEINTPAQYVGDNIQFVRGVWADLRELIAAHVAIAEQARAAGVAPDLCRAAAELAAKIDLPFVAAETGRALDEAREGVERIGEIVRAMKSLSRPVGEHHAACDLNEVVRICLTATRSTWESAAVIETDLEVGLPAVPTGRDEMQQVVLTLVVNAAQAVRGLGGPGPAGGLIRICTRWAGGHAELTVSDNRREAPEALRGQVFDPFFTTKDIGIGELSLASAQEIVAGHNGQVGFETTPGSGTTFFVRLPLEAA